MSDATLDVLAAAIGAAVAVLIEHWYERRRAERATLTEADQKWMAATHGEVPDA